MGYFYVSSRPGCGQGAPRTGAHEMSTKELQKKLRDMGKSDKGQRSVLLERYERYAREEEQEEMTIGQEAPEASKETKERKPHASENPMMVMVDESLSLIHI